MEHLSWVKLPSSRQVDGENDPTPGSQVAEDGLRTVVVVCFIIPYEYIVDRDYERDGIERVGLTWSSFPGSTSGMTGS